MRIWTVVTALLLMACAGWTQTQTQDKTTQAFQAYQQAEKTYHEAVLELQRVDLRDQKRAIIETQMKFSAAQAKAFWPIFDNYEKELIKLNDMRLEVIKDYGAHYVDLTDAKALELAARAMEFQEKRIALRRTYMNNLKPALPGILIARLMQLENQIDLQIDLQVAAEVPKVE